MWFLLFVVQREDKLSNVMILQNNRLIIVVVFVVVVGGNEVIGPANYHCIFPLLLTLEFLSYVSAFYCNTRHGKHTVQY